ncbi:MAG: flavodoxin family protein [Deltaproteobacteria bacterium]|nr:flavodoxin family protein [Deltaproteobacteria bacterium]
MHIIAFNGSPRKSGNTSTIIKAMLKGAKAAGAETTEVRLHDIDMKGCLGCLTCRTRAGKCKQKDALTPFIEALRNSDGAIFGTPIYMYHVTGQMKMFIDRIYHLFISKPDSPGTYETALSPGKTYAIVTSQGHHDIERFQRPVRWLAAMTGGGLGMKEVGRIVQVNSHQVPVKEDKALLGEAYRIGQKLVTESKA